MWVGSMNLDLMGKESEQKNMLITQVPEMLKVSAPSLVKLERHLGHQLSKCSSRKTHVSCDQNPPVTFH